MARVQPLGTTTCHLIRNARLMELNTVFCGQAKFYGGKGTNTSRMLHIMPEKVESGFPMKIAASAKTKMSTKTAIRELKPKRNTRLQVSQGLSSNYQARDSCRLLLKHNDALLACGE